MFDIGVMFWAGEDPAATLAQLTKMGVRRGQLGVPGDLPLDSAPAWRRALDDAGFAVQTTVAAFTGESYADIPTVQQTVGFVPHGTRAAREQLMLRISDFAAALGVNSIATHIGFVPEDSREPDYIGVRELVRRVCDHAAKHKQTFALETGQESAETLMAFILDANRENLGINFDPANMILYGAGDPITALEILGPHVLSVHAKDGDWPEPGIPGALGKEQPLGEGAVGMERFLAKLRHVGYNGTLFVEREASDPKQRLVDIERGVALLRKMTSIM